MRRSLLSTKHWQAVGLFLLLLLAFGVVGNLDKESQDQDRLHYCDMVALWDADKARGVPEADRTGWPPFKGKCNE